MLRNSSPDHLVSWAFQPITMWEILFESNVPHHLDQKLQTRADLRLPSPRHPASALPLGQSKPGRQCSPLPRDKSTMAYGHLSPSRLERSNPPNSCRGPSRPSHTRVALRTQCGPMLPVLASALRGATNCCQLVIMRRSIDASFPCASLGFSATLK